MQVPIEVLTMNKSERKIIRLFSQLSIKKRNRVVDVLNDMLDQDENENLDAYPVSEQILKIRDGAVATVAKFKPAYKNMYGVSEQSLKERDEAKAQLDDLLCNDDGTRGDCDPNPKITKKQLDRELDEYMDSDPRDEVFHHMTNLKPFKTA